MKVSIIGTGFVGLVTGVCLADKGHEVYCADIDPSKIELINKGVVPFYEANLEALLTKNLGQSFHATTKVEQAVLSTDLTIVAVGTPHTDTGIDLTYIKQVARQIGEVLAAKDAYHVVVVKSTVVPGTTDEVVLPILEEASGKKAGVDFGVSMNPEFLREGEAVVDFMEPDRIVFGGNDQRTIDVLDSLYAVFEGVDKIATSNKTAEMIKYTANSLLATLISFSNEIGNLCAALGNVDAIEVMQGVHLDKRLSPILPDGSRVRPGLISYLEAGCGFGGSCFPKDVRALISHGDQRGVPMGILKAVVDVNDKQYEQVLRLLGKHYTSFEGLRVAVLGLAFKPGTNDMRESPAIPVIQELQRQGAVIKAYDPVAREDALQLLGNHSIVYPTDLEETVRDVDAVILLTRWSEFDGLPALLETLDQVPVIIDGRRMLDKRQVARYEGIGL